MSDIEINCYVLIKFMSMKPHLYFTEQVDQKNQDSEECFKFLEERSNHDKFNFPDACFCEQCFQVTKTRVISARTEKSKRLLSLAVDFLNLENGITFSVSSCSNTVICFLPVLKGRNTSLCFNPFVLMMAFLL